MKYYENFLKDYLDVDLLSELKSVKDWKDFDRNNSHMREYYGEGQFLNKLRCHLQSKTFVKWVEESFSMKKYDIEIGVFHHLLKACGYEHISVHNMLLVFAAICLILIIWISLAIKDRIG